MDGSPYDELSFLHFNDVYHITQSTALGRLSHIFRKAKEVPESERPITVFSGDAFSPSLESAVLKGEHMVPVLNHLLVDVACYGNHDFDFGEEALVKLSRTCTFPWLLANAVHADGRLLATAEETLVLEKKGYRIGFFGLAGTDWPSNCQHLPADCTILDPISVARRLSNTLRSTYGVDIVIAITHMRQEEDLFLAQACSDDIDLILGGHDHDLSIHGTVEGHIKLVKSGTDFKSFSAINTRLTRSKNGKASLTSIAVAQTHNITLMDDVPEEAGMHAILDAAQTRIADAVDKPLFHSTVPLEGRSSVIRTEETNLGNMLADAVRAYYDTDIALINSGSIRCDRVLEAGILTVKDMIDILPFDNPFVVKRLHGHTLRQALENAASDIIDGRFFQLSGITCHIDRQAPVGARVHSIRVSLTTRRPQRYAHDGRYPDVGRRATTDGDLLLHSNASSSRYGDDKEEGPHAHAARGMTGVPASPSGSSVDPSRTHPLGARPVGSTSTSTSALGSTHGDVIDAASPARADSEEDSTVPLQDEATYTVALAAFIAAGFDGYAMFKDAPTLVDQDAEGVLTDSSLFLHVLSRRDGTGTMQPTTDAVAAVPSPRGSMERARAAIVLGTTVGGLPVVSLTVQRRIKYSSRFITRALIT